MVPALLLLIAPGNSPPPHARVSAIYQRPAADGSLRTDNWNQAWDEDRVADQSRYQMWRLLDYDPPEPIDQGAFNTIVEKVLTHFLSLRLAYPKVFAWLSERQDYLFTYMAAHRDDVEMPLRRIKPAT